MATFPSPGRYRLFLQFKHEGAVHTAAFTQAVATMSDVRDHLELPITGMTCASCANRIERRLNKLDGVSATRQLRDRAGDRRLRRGRVAPDELVAAVEAAGYGAVLPERGAGAPAPRTTSRTRRRRCAAGS